MYSPHMTVSQARTWQDEFDREAGMEREFLEDRRRGLEEAFFAQHDAALLRRLREAGEAKAKREALAAASGITDDALLDRLVALGISSETLTALSLIPMVAVAW